MSDHVEAVERAIDMIGDGLDQFAILEDADPDLAISHEQKMRLHEMAEVIREILRGYA